MVSRLSLGLWAALVAGLLLAGAPGAGRAAPAGWLAVARSVDNAWEMPPFVLKDLEGRDRRLSDWKGQVIVLNFWATWCPPCQAEVPRLIEYQRRYAGQGLQVVSIGLDDERKLRNFVRTYGVNYPVLLGDLDRDLRLLAHWGDPQQVLPYTVVIGRDGHLHLMLQGPIDDAAFGHYVLPLLQQAPPVPTKDV